MATKLYSLDSDEWKALGRGKIFRTGSLYKCSLCHLETNSVTVGGLFFRRYPLFSCKGAFYAEHDEIKSLNDKIADISDELMDFKEKGKGLIHMVNYPARSPDYDASQNVDLSEVRYIKELQSYRDTVLSEIWDLRLLFAQKLLPDLDGIVSGPNGAKPIYFYPNVSYRGKKSSVRGCPNVPSQYATV